MSSDQNLFEDLNRLKTQIQSNLVEARTGNIIDISKLPDQLLDLHNRVTKITEEERPPLTCAYEEVLAALDELSQEIQQRYNEISGKIKILDGDVSDKKE